MAWTRDGSAPIIGKHETSSDIVRWTKANRKIEKCAATV
jgi:hypothetical protein